MSKRLEDLRKVIGVKPGPLNQRDLKGWVERNKLFFGSDSKAHKAEQRKIREEKFVRQLPRIQFDRALHHMLDGTAGPEEALYFFKKVDEGFGRPVDKNITFVFIPPTKRSK